MWKITSCVTKYVYLNCKSQAHAFYLENSLFFHAWRWRMPESGVCAGIGSTVLVCSQTILPISDLSDVVPYLFTPHALEPLC